MEIRMTNPKTIAKFWFRVQGLTGAGLTCGGLAISETSNSSVEGEH